MGETKEPSVLDIDAIERVAEKALTAEESPWVVKTSDARIAEYLRAMAPDVTLDLVASVRHLRKVAAAERALRKSLTRYLMACIDRRETERVAASVEVTICTDALAALGVEP